MRAYRQFLGLATILVIVPIATTCGDSTGPAFGPAAKLAFTVQPSNVVAGAAITPGVQVAVQDAQGNTVTNSTASIAMAITSGGGTTGAVLGGTLTMAAVNGVATFSTLTVDKVGTGYTLTATAASLTSATSTAFNVTSGADVEALIKGTFRTIFNGTLGTEGIAPSARAMSWENSSSLSNWGMGPRSAVPRAFIDNSPGNANATENYADFVALTRGLRDAANGVHWMSGAAAQGARARAFGFLSVGVAMGYLSLVYDSAAIVLPSDSIGLIRELSSYAAVNAAALDALDSAMVWTSTAKTMTGGYGTSTMFDVSWINGVTFTADDFTRLIRTYKAHFRANVARTPTERAAVLWTQVRDDAANGITADIVVTTATSPSWTIALNQIYLYAQWGQASTFIIGMADTSGAYDAWLAAPNANRMPFPVVTADRRFPRGLNRAEQSSLTNSPVVPRDTIQYLRNRSGGDAPSDVYGQSQYDFYRFQPWYNTQRIGSNGPAMLSRNQIDMLQAEALIRTSDFAGAMVLINRYRTRAGLPPLVGITARGQPVPGSANGCVPRVPKGPAFTSAACGDIWEAMKWEFRMENMYIGYAAWYFPSRGWGDLPLGTALHWPVPYQEMATRGHPSHNLGGVGMPGGAVGKGTYGY